MLGRFIVSMALASTATSAWSQDVQDRDAAGSGSEIIVTGERVAREQEQVLSSVTVVTGEEVDRSGERGVYEAIVGAPNVLPAPGEFLPPIRGDESGGPGGLFGGVLFGTQPRATLILDDVPRISSGANNSATSIFDVAQVEVLRGPQTTLRGANAISGAFLIVTRRPSERLEAAALGELVDNAVVDPTYRVAGMLNLPIAQGIALRLTAERIDGSVPIIVRPYDPLDPANPPLRPGTGYEDLSRFGRNRFRGQLLVAPSQLSGFELLLQGEHETGVDVGFDSFVNDPSFFTNQAAGGFPEVTSIKDRVFG